MLQPSIKAKMQTQIKQLKSIAAISSSLADSIEQSCSMDAEIYLDSADIKLIKDSVKILEVVNKDAN